MKNILVATDFSNNAYSALYYATQLLASNPCTFHILNVYDELTPIHGKKAKLFGNKNQLEKIQAESKEKLTKTAHRIVLDTGNPKHLFKTISKIGNLSKIITKTVDNEEIDLVVMGNKGLTEASDIFFGSNTIKVVDQIDTCPVFAIPGEMQYKEPNEIAFITDFKKGCTEKSIAPLLFLASLTKASIRVMHITEKEILNNEQEAYKKQLMYFLKDIEHSFHRMQAFDDKAKVIDVFLKKLKVDVYAMVNHKHNLFEKLTHEPVIKDVSMYADIPFLILPYQE